MDPTLTTPRIGGGGCEPDLPTLPISSCGRGSFGPGIFETPIASSRFSRAAGEVERFCDPAQASRFPIAISSRERDRVSTSSVSVRSMAARQPGLSSDSMVMPCRCSPRAVAMGQIPALQPGEIVHRGMPAFTVRSRHPPCQAGIAPAGAARVITARAARCRPATLALALALILTLAGRWAAWVSLGLVQLNKSLAVDICRLESLISGRHIYKYCSSTDFRLCKLPSPIPEVLR